MNALKVTSPDGVELAVQTWGASEGPEILFFHGFNQSYLSWARQVNDPALAGCRMVTMDLRGHGASGKPEDPAFYRDDRRWADDVAAVIAATGLTRPVLVGWSYAGRVITDYVRFHGQEKIAGINFVAAVIKTGGGHMGPGRDHFKPMTNGDLALNISGTRGFVRACFAVPPTAEEFETMVAFNMVAPPRVRKMVLDRTPNDGDILATLRLPVLLTHGTQDQVIRPGMSIDGSKLIPNARLSLYDGIGHVPFMEDTARFDAELLAFARAASA